METHRFNKSFPHSALKEGALCVASVLTSSVREISWDIRILIFVLAGLFISVKTFPLSHIQTIVCPVKSWIINKLLPRLNMVKGRLERQEQSITSTI